MLLKKKKLGKMLIEQIIEFDVRGHGPPLVVHVLLQLVIFKTKQKSLRNIFEYIILLFTSKNCRRQCSLFSLSGPNHLQNLIPNLRF